MQRIWSLLALAGLIMGMPVWGESCGQIDKITSDKNFATYISITSKDGKLNSWISGSNTGLVAMAEAAFVSGATFCVVQESDVGGVSQAYITK